MSRLRNICFTLNNWSDDQYKSLINLDVKYIVIGKEVGESGTPHLQGYVEFNNSTSFKSIQKKFFKAHIEMRHGSPKQASDYCKKDDKDFFEKGIISEQGKRKDIEVLAELVIDGNNNRSIAKLNPVGYMKFNKHVNALRSALIEPRDGSIAPNIAVYHGPTGSGKTRMAYDQMKELDEPYYVWTPARDNWFDGYAGEKNVIFDEFRGQIPLGILLTILDRYECPLQYKGGTTEFVGMNIILTSPKHPESWYVNRNNDHVDQLLRRICKIIQFENDA